MDEEGGGVEELGVSLGGVDVGSGGGVELAIDSEIDDNKDERTDESSGVLEAATPLR